MTTAGDLKTTELRLGLPGSDSPERPVKGHGSKRGFSDAIDGGGKWVLEVERKGADFGSGEGKDGVGEEKKGTESSGSAAKAQVVGWPPIRNYRKNTMAANTKSNADAEEKQELGCLYVKVSMDGAPYLRKVDLRTYTNYKELSTALMKMFSCFTIGPCGSQEISNKDGLSENRMRDMHGSMYVLIYEDRDGDWMLSGDVPWEMFTDSCRRLRIMKASDAIGLELIVPRLRKISEAKCSELNEHREKARATNSSLAASN